MLNLGILVLALHPANSTPPAPAPSLVDQISQSGRVTTLADTADERVNPHPQIAPGPPPALSFRLYEGKSHHRYDNGGLMLDDAGH